MAYTEEKPIAQKLLEIMEQLVTEPDYMVTAEHIIQTAVTSANADVGMFFSVLDNKFINLEYCYAPKLRIDRANIENLGLFSSLFIPDAKNKPLKKPLEQCVLKAGIINFDNLYANPDFDTANYARFDESFDTSTVSVLLLPLIDHHRNVIGVTLFINARNPNGQIISFTPEQQKNLVSLCSSLTIITENKNLREAYRQLLESFIEVLARAIDAKSPYTGSHCQRVPIITRLLATAAVEEDAGKLKDFTMSPDDWYSLHIASWLHDCGKVTTPEYIVDKATKLETINNRIHEIRNRFEILRRDAHIEYLQKRLHQTDTQENLQAEFVAKVKKLEDDFAFVAACNKGDKPLVDADISRLEHISKAKFTRYFNRMLGLSWAERENIKDREIFEHPAEENLLQNRPDQIFGPYNRGELYNLEVRQGTITKEEREKINEHIVVTIDMLKALPFPQELSKVVEYAGCHHERVDGKGYPNGLTGDQMSVPAKIMAIADIFEALTASDRPYKEPKKLSEVLHIMQEMKNTGHIDPDLYDVFIRGEVYKDYAEQYIKPSQIDEINPEDYL